MYECYTGEEVLENQKEAFAMFEDNAKEVAGSLDQVKKYVKKTGAAQLAGDELKTSSSTLCEKHLVPHSKKHHTVAICATTN